MTGTALIRSQIAINPTFNNFMKCLLFPVCRDTNRSTESGRSPFHYTRKRERYENDKTEKKVKRTIREDHSQSQRLMEDHALSQKLVEWDFAQDSLTSPLGYEG